MGPEVQTYVIYDIQDDRVRYRVANACKDYGLERIQFSAFAGLLNANRRDELFLRLSRELDKHAGKIMVLPVCEKDQRARRELINHESVVGASADDVG